MAIPDSAAGVDPVLFSGENPPKESCVPETELVVPRGPLVPPAAVTRVWKGLCLCVAAPGGGDSDTFSAVPVLVLLLFLPRPWRGLEVIKASRAALGSFGRAEWQH